jgi:hypothetical protein
MVEFGHYLRQQRLTAGVEDMRYAAELVDQAMRRDASGKPVIDRDYLANVERGHSGVSDPMWGTESDADVGPLRVYVPYEVAEAYDTAFGADGYLVDVHHWPGSATASTPSSRQQPRRPFPMTSPSMTLSACCGRDSPHMTRRQARSSLAVRRPCE